MTDTVHQAFTAAAQRWDDRPFLCVLPETAAIYDIAAGELTYADALRRIEALRDAYAAAGYGQGHRVGVLLENRPAFFLHWFALNALGVSIVPINPDMRAAELEYLVGQPELALAVALAPRHAELAAAATRAGRPFTAMADGDTPPPAAFAAPLAGTAVDESSECALLYTSGTTGRPKGCILPNRWCT